MADRKVIWLVCNNVQPPEIDTHLRHQKFARYLYEDGYDVFIVGASYLHYAKKQLIEGKERYIFKEYPNLKYYFIKVSTYQENTGIKRILSTSQFAWNLFKLRNKLPKPNIIVHNTRIPFDLPIYWIAKRLKAHYITETWDLWPLAFETQGLIKKNSLLLKLFYLIERYIYTKADKNIFTLAGCKQYITDKKWDINSGGSIDLKKISYINNGVDIEDFDYCVKNYKLTIPELENEESFKFLYLGSIGHVNAVEYIIDSAKLFPPSSNAVFLIFGKGIERQRLEDRVKKEHINNVHFLNEWIEIKYVPYILSCASVNLLNYSRSENGKYGGSQGKLFQYLAAGKPIVSNNIMGYDIINHYHAGISENIDSPEQYKEVLCTIMNNPLLYQQMCVASKNASLDFDFRKLYKDFLRVIKDVS